MKIEKLFESAGFCHQAGCFDLICSKGMIDGSEGENIRKEGNSVIAETSDFRAEMQLEKQNGVYVRRDFFTNLSDEPIVLNRYYARFSFVTDNAQVYTQFSNWCNESQGAWQTLKTSISVENAGVRTAQEGTPMLGLWDENTGRGVAFHLIANASWKMSAKKAASTMTDHVVVVEAGILDERLALSVAPGETVTLPEIIFFDFDSKTDMGCTKLHQYWNMTYPKKQLPVIYNSWFLNFDEVSFDLFADQAKIAARLGFEYFVVDAGWFGDGKAWSDAIGEWKENQTGAFCGRLREFADLVRSLGMKFGLWIEAERALGGTDGVLAHPDYYFKHQNDYFVDYANPEARAYILEIVLGLVKQYDVSFIKFDFNANCPYDKRGTAYYRYHEGHRKFLQEIRQAFPEIYLENCASGGFRMDLEHCRTMDSTWFSDNQNPYYGMKIYRETMLRLPPNRLERWGAVNGISDFIRVYAQSDRRLLTVCGPTWKIVESVDMAYMQGFLSGGPLGMTCNLATLSEEEQEQLKNIIDRFKRLRPFYLNCTCRILIANDTLTVLQYTDPEETKILLQVFETNCHQQELTVYPKLSKQKQYCADNFKISSAELSEEGVTLPLSHEIRCAETLLEEF